MKIKMTKTTEGATDKSGTKSMTYEKGKKYDVHDSLAENFIGQNAAKEDKEKEKAPENEEKEKAPENKEEVPENKEEEAPADNGMSPQPGPPEDKEEEAPENKGGKEDKKE